jgi:N-acetylmuramoyl-L-alanine amidase
MLKKIIPFVKIVATISLMPACNSSLRPVLQKSKNSNARSLENAQAKQLQPPIIPPKSTEYDTSTVNYGLRKPNFVIIHHTAQNSCAETIRTFSLPRTRVSSHYIICKDGTVHFILSDYLRAWHAGLSKWGSLTDVNSSSVGIELDNNGFEPFAEPQINSLLVLLDTLKQRHNIPVSNFIGHGDIAPTRKNDPSMLFPWKKLADNGFGYWYNDTINVVVPPAFNHLQALRIIGFDVTDTTAAIVAFKRHFVQDSTSTFMNEKDRKILYSVYEKYY